MSMKLYNDRVEVTLADEKKSAYTFKGNKIFSGTGEGLAEVTADKRADILAALNTEVQEFVKKSPVDHKVNDAQVTSLRAKIQTFKNEPVMLESKKLLDAAGHSINALHNGFNRAAFPELLQATYHQPEALNLLPEKQFMLIHNDKKLATELEARRKAAKGVMDKLGALSEFKAEEVTKILSGANVKDVQGIFDSVVEKATSGAEEAAYGQKAVFAHAEEIRTALTAYDQKVEAVLSGFRFRKNGEQATGLVEAAAHVLKNPKDKKTAKALHDYLEQNKEVATSIRAEFDADTRIGSEGIKKLLGNEHLKDVMGTISKATGGVEGTSENKGSFLGKTARFLFGKGEESLTKLAAEKGVEVEKLSLLQKASIPKVVGAAVVAGIGYAMTGRGEEQQQEQGKPVLGKYTQMVANDPQMQVAAGASR